MENLWIDEEDLRVGVCFKDRNVLHNQNDAVKLGSFSSSA